MRPIVAVCLLSSLLAGCTGSGDSPSAAVAPGLTDDLTAPLAVVETEDGFVLNRDLLANDTLDAPVPWRVGDWFGVHVLMQGGPSEGTHYNSIVVSETDSDWMLAADNSEAAIDEAVFDL